MANNIAGARAGQITSTFVTTDAELRYQRAVAAPAGVDATRWRGLARGLDRAADGEYTLAERLRLRGLADRCRARAARMSPSGKFAARSGKAVAA